MSLNVVTLLASHNHCRFDSTLRRLIALIREMGIGMNVNCHGFTRKSHICSSWFSTVELFRFWVTYLVLLITGLGLASRRSFAGLLVGSLSSHKLKGSIRAVPHRRGCIGSMAAPIRRTQMSRPVPSPIDKSTSSKLKRASSCVNKTAKSSDQTKNEAVSLP